MDNMSCMILELLHSMEIYLRPLEELSPARGAVRTIELESGSSPVSRVLYQLAAAEMTELKEHMEDSSDMDFIRPSTSPWGASLLIVKREDWSFRICIDYIDPQLLG